MMDRRRLLMSVAAGERWPLSARFAPSPTPLWRRPPRPTSTP